MDVVNWFTGWNFFWLWPISWVAIAVGFWSNMKKVGNRKLGIALSILLGPFLLMVLAFGSLLFPFLADNKKVVEKASKDIANPINEIIAKIQKGRDDAHKMLYDLVSKGMLSASSVEIMIMYLEHAAIVSMIAEDRKEKKTQAEIDEIVTESIPALVAAASVSEELFLSTLSLAACRVKQLSDKMFDNWKKQEGEKTT